MYARSTTIKGDPGSIDAGIAFIRDEVMPTITTMDGCLGMSLLVDREAARGIATTSWRDEESLRASRELLASYRERGGEIMGGSPEVDEWEVAVMHRDHNSHDGSCCRVTWGRPTDIGGMADYFRQFVLPQVEAMDGFCSASLFLDRAGRRHCGTVTFDSPGCPGGESRHGGLHAPGGHRPGPGAVLRRRRVRPRDRAPEAARAGLSRTIRASPAAPGEAPGRVRDADPPGHCPCRRTGGSWVERRRRWGAVPEQGGATVYARSITIMGDPHRLEDGIAYVRDEVLPVITTMDGCVGLSMLADRESGQCIVTSSWRDEETMQASDLHLAPLRTRGSQILGANPQVEEWEVAVMHRDHHAPEGSCCRATWLRLNQGDFDRGINLYRTAMLPAMESLEGFCSASLLVNRGLSRACTTTTYDSRAAMDAGRDRAWTIRDAGVREAGVDVLDVAEFDLVVAHLRVPEMV